MYIKIINYNFGKIFEQLVIVFMLGSRPNFGI